MARLAVLFTLAVAVSLVLTPLVRRLAIWAGVLDLPGERRVHAHPIPRLGGLAVYATLAIVLSIVPLGGADFTNLTSLWTQWLPTFAFAATLVMLVGAVDDVRSLSPWIKLIVEVIAAVIVTSAYGLRSEIPGIDSPWVGQVITIVWIVAITNAFNLIDGLDGLAAGLGVIVAATLACICVYSLNYPAACLLVILGGALVGFLRYNFYPSQIFLGDSGSLLVGFVLAVISISATSRLSSMVAILVPVIALGVPLIETVLTASRRVLRSIHIDADDEGERYGFTVTRPQLFTADREHIHHRLLDLGLSHRGAVMVLYAASLVFGTVAFLVVAQRTPYHAMFVASFGLVSFIGIRRLNYGEINLLRNGTLLPIFQMPLVNRRLLHVLVDLGFITCSYLGAFLIVYDFDLGPAARFKFLVTAPAVGLAQLVCLWGTGLYRGAYRYTGIGDLLTIGRGVLFAIVTGWVAALVAGQGAWPQISLMVLDGYLLGTFVGGSRIAFTVLDFIFKRERPSGTRVLLYGAGRTGTLALKEIQSNRDLAMRPIGFLDDDPTFHRRTVSGYPVHPTHDLDALINRRAFDQLIVVTTRVSDQQVLSIAERCEVAGIPVRRFTIGWQEIRSRTEIPREESLPLALEPEISDRVA